MMLCYATWPQHLNASSNYHPLLASTVYSVLTIDRAFAFEHVFSQAHQCEECMNNFLVQKTTSLLSKLLLDRVQLLAILLSQRKQCRQIVKNSLFGLDRTLQYFAFAENTY